MLICSELIYNSIRELFVYSTYFFVFVLPNRELISFRSQGGGSPSSNYVYPRLGSRNMILVIKKFWLWLEN